MRAPRIMLSALMGLALLAPGTAAVPAAVPMPAAPPSGFSYSVTPAATGLQIPWDVTWIGGLMLFDERPGRLWTLRPGGSPVRVNLPLPKIFQGSEAGLLGLVADPQATSNGFFYTCMSVAKASGAASDVQVWKWRLVDEANAVKVATLVKGIPIGYGRHNGCRLLFRSTQMLYIATGDAAKGTNPQSRSSLGGKVLRIRSDGSIPKSNPYYRKGGSARLVWSYGHRNLQGLALRPGTTELWSAEHGPDRDDEVNRIFKSGNYGWSPTPGYNERRSMTDRKRFPKAVKARWRSGYPTVATSGAAFLSGTGWGRWKGALAVAELKGEGILVFTVSRTGKLTKTGEIATSYGRIRAVRQGPDGALYFTTSNGTNDAIYRLASS
jgi:aldose sugar dehydrogenase